LFLQKEHHFKSLFTIQSEQTETTLHLHGALFFSNYLSLKKRIDKALQSDKLELDFADVTLIDHTVVHHLETYRKVLKREGKFFEYRNMNHLIPVSDDELAERRTGIERSTAIKKLSKRQTDLLALAASNGWNYTLKQDWNGVWDFYTITLRKKIISLENILTNSDSFISYTTADIITQEGARTTAEYQNVTVLKISGLREFPKFYMAEETLMDKLTNLISGDDINFDSHPVFSKNFILKGEDSSAVRKVFTSEILAFFEANLDLMLISNGQDILLRSQYRFLNQTEIIKLNRRAEELVKLLDLQK
jgi:carbonic anhydrase